MVSRGRVIGGVSSVRSRIVGGLVIVEAPVEDAELVEEEQLIWNLPLECATRLT